MKGDLNRRNILTILGLAPLGTAAVAAEQFNTLEPNPPTVPGLMQPSEAAQDKIALALENMARAIRARELTGIKIEINSVVSFHEWMQHEVRVLCELNEASGK